jgi:hypothetical protein
MSVTGTIRAKSPSAKPTTELRGISRLEPKGSASLWRSYSHANPALAIRKLRIDIEKL